MQPAGSMIWRTFVAVIAALCLATPSWPVSAQTPKKGAQSEAFFGSSQLRASGQRIARLYLESGTNIRPNRTRVLLEQEVKSYEQILAELQKQKSDSTLLKHVNKVVEVWAEMKPIVTAPFSKDKAEPLYDLSEQLYIQTSKMTFHLEDQADSETGYLVDVSGRNASLSERIAKASFLHVHSKKGGSLVDFETWKKEYVDGYEKLEESKLNDEYAKGNLKLGRMMWSLFDGTITDVIKKNDTSRLIDISKSADGMWDIAQSSKKQYEVMFRQQLQQGGQFASKPAKKGT